MAFDMFDSAQLCRDNNWGPGTRLVGDEGYGPTVIEITAIGEQTILAKLISAKGRNVTDESDRVWTLAHRDWEPAE